MDTDENVYETNHEPAAKVNYIILQQGDPWYNQTI